MDDKGVMSLQGVIDWAQGGLMENSYEPPTHPPNKEEAIEM